MKKLIPPVLFVICVIVMGLLRWLWPIKTVFPYPYNLLGIVPAGAGLAIGALGAHQFRKARTNIRPFVAADKLVTDGPFRYTRNPMYLGISLVLVGTWMLLGVLSALVGILIFVVVADRWYIPFEERMLQRQFGSSFDAYRSKVRRWV